jgi:predicted Zn-dependent peptidase
VRGAEADRIGATAPGIPAPPGAGEPRTSFLVKPTEQVHVCLGAPGIARDDERRFALRVLDNVFGGTSSSRLFQEVRERRGLAYAVYSFQSLYAGSGQVGLYLGTRPDNVREALDVVATELGRLRAEPATEAELRRSKENVKGRMVLALESTSARMNRLGSSVLAGMPLLTVDEVVERIEAVSLADLEGLATELFAPGRLSAVGIGPDEGAFRTALEALTVAA